MADTKTESKADVRAREASTVGVDSNEEMVRRHDNFDKASDHPNPNPYVAGQTPAAETNQPTLARDRDELGAAVANVQSVLSYAVHYEGGQAVIYDRHRDAVTAALEDALRKSKKS